MDDLDKCRKTCWIVGAIVGLVVFVLLIGPADYGFIWALIWALIAGLLVGFLLPYVICKGNEEVVGSQSVSSDTSPAPPQSAPQSAASSESLDENSVATKPEPTPEPDPTPAPESTPMAPPEPADTGGSSNGPALLSSARGGVADDLKRIKGVGPKLESSLNAAGIYHFDQIAAWNDSDVDWADERFGGSLKRVRRDEWVSQARVLADGGDTDFSKRVDKGDVY
ncbi:MAG: NADH:ubiquinone oxidoreductase [Boseongicola sp.]